MNFKKIAGYLLIPICCFILSACSSGGGGGDKNDPAEGNTWDQMQWDKGSWS